jgi:hypothetical protein
MRTGRDPGYEDSGCASGRAGCRAVLPADHGPHEIVLPDRTPGRKAYDSEQIGGDHDMSALRNSVLFLEARLQILEVYRNSGL